jgi:hypothetical protein
MLEVYLITRLTALNVFFFAVAIITGTIAIVCAIVYGINYMDGYYVDRDKLQIALKKWVRNCTITCVAATLFNIFTPTTKDAMLIYGVGTTVDFLQENENVQQLPDKCVKALNDWVDSLVEDNVGSKG